jgi:hypothetical protein
LLSAVPGCSASSGRRRALLAAPEVAPEEMVERQAPAVAVRLFGLLQPVPLLGRDAGLLRDKEAAAYAGAGSLLLWRCQT